MEELNSENNKQYESASLVSIGMPVYNDRHFVKRAIESLLNQSYTNFELIISDDCSTDGSAQICEAFSKLDSRIKYVRQEKNIGISRNMEFLLNQARGKYFMWAANDDSWHTDFIKMLKNNLDANPNAISSFCAFALIDESDNLIAGSEFIVEDYRDATRSGRLTKLIKQRTDGFGYGLFIREKILGVRFPVWWWINKKCAYNNIYPTLCYYLTKGEYVLYTNEVLWFNRVKSKEKVNHTIPFSNVFILCFFAFLLRRFNCAYVSLMAIARAEKGIRTAILISPKMFYYWFLVYVKPLAKYRSFKNRDMGAFV